MMKRIATIATIVFLILNFALLAFMNVGSADSITGKTAINSGLPTTTTCTTITVADVDDDGLDEMYIGGAGYSGSMTQGIASYEYSTQSSSWSSFASGLPGTSSGKYYGKLSFGDIDEDGDLDLVAGIHDRWSNSNSNGVEIYTSNGASTFTLAHTIDVGSGGGASVDEVKVADMDADGDLDIVVAENSGVRVFFGSGSTSSWTESSPSATNTEVDAVGVGDLNGDGLLDVVGTLYSSTESKIFILGSSRSWTTLSSWFSSSSSKSAGFGCRIADLDNDGNNDVVYGTRSYGIRVWLGNGGGSTGGTSFSWTSSTSGLPTSRGDYLQLEVADLNDDNKTDIICSTGRDDKTHVYLNNMSTGWNEIFTGTQSLSHQSDAYGAAFGDWDADGDLDVAGGSWDDGAKAWLVSRTVQPPPPEPRNQRPVPNAGADIEQMLGTTVQLDGTNSTDADDAPDGDTTGTKLTYEWNFTRVPPGSVMNDDSLQANDSISSPSFTPDVPGIYDLSLAVYDGDFWSNQTDEDNIRILVLKPNEEPVADAGHDISGYEGETFTLDGSNSYDPDGEIIYYEWTCQSHSIVLTDDGTEAPSFTAHEPGIYNFSLRVRDDNDTWSAESDNVKVNVIEIGKNVPPVAHAGSDQTVTRGDIVELSGTAEDIDGEIVTWEWSCSSHTVTFTDQNTSTPSFTAQEAGIYVISLRVRDDNSTWSEPDTLNVVSEEPYFNDIPVADAGEDLTGFVGDKITLDGSGSSDANGDVVKYNWTCTSHTVSLSEVLTATPSFTPQEAGTYIFTLAVCDNEGAWSPEDEIRVVINDRPPVLHDIDIGPFLYDDTTPVTEGEVILKLDSGAEPITSPLNGDGFASFSSITPGTHTFELRQNGSTVLGPYSFSLSRSGSLTYLGDGIGLLEKPSTDTDTDTDTDIDTDTDTDTDTDGGNNEDKEGISPFVIIIPLILILGIAGGGVYFFLYMKNREEEETSDGDKTPKDCPECGSVMEFREDFEKYYCEECGRYRR